MSKKDKIDNENQTETEVVEAISDKSTNDETVENTETDSLETQLENAKKEATKNLDIALRNQAETENIRRRMTKDIESAHKFSTEKFARELLDVADSIELGLKASEDKNVTTETLIEGMTLTKQQLFGTFERLNIEVIDAKDTQFNPDLHEAMTTIPNPEIAPNTVVEVIQKGYTLNERLLRPSRVIVSKN